MIVHGEAGADSENSRGYAQNMVYLPDRKSWSHIDVTNEITKPPAVVSHKYYMLNDDQIAADHEWDRDIHPKCR